MHLATPIDAHLHRRIVQHTRAEAKKLVGKQLSDVEAFALLWPGEVRADGLTCLMQDLTGRVSSWDKHVKSALEKHRIFGYHAVLPTKQGVLLLADSLEGSLAIQLHIRGSGLLTFPADTAFPGRPLLHGRDGAPAP